MAPQEMTQCPECKATSLQDGVCLNVDCPSAQRAATREASRSTAKATARTDRPAAFSSSGRVD